MEPLEVIEGRDWLEFAGVASPLVYTIPREQQFSEKLHAYTLPRQSTVNSRVQDLVDMVLLMLIIGTPTRLTRVKQINGYVEMIPSEDSSGGKQRLGHISEQGKGINRNGRVHAIDILILRG
jgi:hypothetical protein